MKATAYLLRSGSVVVRAGTEEPNDFVAYLRIDSGISEDWPFTVRLAEKQILDKYVIAGGRALPVEPHCGFKTFRLDKTRFNADGSTHECKRRKK